MSARRGNKQAQAQLVGPPMPHTLTHLRNWLYELHGRSGVLPNGELAPLSYTTIRDWALLKDEPIQPYEVDALIKLDDVMRHPELGLAKDPEKPEVKAAQAARYAWPTKKS